MRLPDTPNSCIDLDLMIQLNKYAEGMSWRTGEQLGQAESKECTRLHSALVQLIDGVLGPLLDRVTAREMKTFTMHDSRHGLKVAHIMWHILSEQRRAALSPPEIAMLVISAHLHDMGMGMSEEDRQARLDPSSTIWLKVDIAKQYKDRFEELRQQITTKQLSPELAALALDQVEEAQDALLCADIRELHATPKRYRELIALCQGMHEADPLRIASFQAATHFDGDSFESGLVDVCVSHNEDASELLSSMPHDRTKERFPSNYPVGTCVVNLKIVAATLRLADILDFDRERVPAVLYHYLLPRSANPATNVSVREWQKHMAISNWDFATTGVIFRGRSTNPIAHHAVIEFCKVIEDELTRTHAVFKDASWPFGIGSHVTVEMHSDGFSYLPYRFHMQEEKIFALLMGPAIYGNPVVAIRELLQNSVDACALRDALISVYRPTIKPAVSDRIEITYQDRKTKNDSAILTVSDSGTGMDSWVISNYFLKVGESYYQSSEFLRTNAELWKFAEVFTPVSEFGIGFISCFMLADRVQVETAMWNSPRQDTTRRILDIDGLGRLIHVTEFNNNGYQAFEGTRVTMHLRNDLDSPREIDWASIKRYLRETCVDLPYTLHLKRVSAEGDVIERENIEANGLSVKLADDIVSGVQRFKVGGPDKIVEGEIVLFSKRRLVESAAVKMAQGPIRVVEHEVAGHSTDTLSVLSRGGFAIGEVPGLPSYVGLGGCSSAFIRINAKKNASARMLKTDLARTNLIDGQVEITREIIEAWLRPLLNDPNEVERIGLGALTLSRRSQYGRAGHSCAFSIYEFEWLQSYSAYDLYLLGKPMWIDSLGVDGQRLVAEWETGRGSSLHLNRIFGYLHTILFYNSLPLISRILVNEEASLYVSPPCSGWIDKLKSTSAVNLSSLIWDNFATYIQRARGYLYYKYSSMDWLSDEYREILAGYSDAELGCIRRCFIRLIDGRSSGKIVELSRGEAELLQKLCRLLPEAIVGSYNVEKLRLKDLCDKLVLHA